MIKTKTWVIIICATFAVSAALALIIPSLKTDGTIANVYLDGVCIRSIDLERVKTPYSFTVTSERGENTILVERGRICVQSADCPDRICVDQGWLSGSVSPIVCLPHRLIIRIERRAKSDIDAISQ